MNYFSFSEIFIGISVFIVCGFFTALIIESIKLLLFCKNGLLRLPNHLYKNRRFFFGRRFIFEPREGKGLDLAITDFCSVLILFVFYILFSYLCFDGIFRGIYFAILLASYFIAQKYLVVLYSRMLFRLFRLFFAFFPCIIAPLVFLFCKLLFVLKLPVLAIISSVRLFVLILLSKQRTGALIKKTPLTCKKMIAEAMEACT